MGIYVLYAILGVICVWDGKTYTIPNVFPFLGTLMALGISYWDNGWSGLTSTFYQLAIGFAVFLCLWIVLELMRMPAMGGGDMKVFIMISGFIGFYETMAVFYYSILLASVLFLLFSPVQVKAMFDRLVYLFLYHIPAREEGPMKKMAFAIPIFISFFLVERGFL